MARFYGTVKGKAASVASREGTEQTGIMSHTGGWDVGIRVVCHVRQDSVAGKLDECLVHLTGGSNNPQSIRQLAVAESNPEGGAPHAWPSK